MNATSMMRFALATSSLAAFCATLAALFLVDVRDPSKDLIVFMLGQLSGLLGAAWAYYFNTTVSSTSKDTTIQNLTKTD